MSPPRASKQHLSSSAVSQTDPRLALFTALIPTSPLQLQVAKNTRRVLRRRPGGSRWALLGLEHTRMPHSLPGEEQGHFSKAVCKETWANSTAAPVPGRSPPPQAPQHPPVGCPAHAQHTHSPSTGQAGARSCPCTTSWPHFSVSTPVVSPGSCLQRNEDAPAAL